MKDLHIKKLYYSISEVSRLVGEEHYVLRYWETEFDQLKPQKNRAGNRIYTQKDITVIKAIKRLLRDNRYTIDGAKDIMKKHFDPASGELVGLEDEKLRTAPAEDAVLEDESSNKEKIELTRGELLAIRSDLLEVLEELA